MDMFENIVHHMAVNTDLGAVTARQEMTLSSRGFGNRA